MNAVSFAREQLARGMSDEALRRAMGVTLRRWPEVRAGLRAAAVPEPPPPSPASAPPPPPLDTAAGRRLARQQEARVARARRLAEREELRVRRLAAAEQARTEKQKARLRQIEEREARERAEQARNAEIKARARAAAQTHDEVRARAEKLVAMVREVAATVQVSPRRPLLAVTVRHYTAWLLRSHVPQITKREVAAMLNWTNDAAVTRSLDLVHVQLQSPTAYKGLAKLHAAMRVVLKSGRDCAACASLSPGVEEK